METVQALAQYLLQVVSVTLLQIVVLLGPLLLASLASHLISRRVESLLVALVSPKLYLYTLGWLGTPVHELGHALMCKLFGHRVDEVKLFQPDSATGHIGFVRHSYNRRNLYHRVGNLFIALGPVILGGLLVLLLGRGLVGRWFHSGKSALADIDNLWQVLPALASWLWILTKGLWAFAASLDFGNALTWLFLYLALAIGTHANLSPADLKTARSGMVVFVVGLTAVNLLLVFVLDNPAALLATPAAGLGMLASVVLLCAGLLVPVWLVLELLWKLAGR